MSKLFSVIGQEPQRPPGLWFPALDAPPAALMHDAGCIMTRRTTVTADEGDLATLEAEARRRGLPLAKLMREAVHDQAVELQSRRRPRLGVAASGDGRSAAEVTADPVAHSPT